MTIYTGDCIEVMAGMPADSVDAVVTDPPYGLEFMGKDWDSLDAGLPQENVWKGRRGQGGGSVGTDDSKPGSRHHVGYGGSKAGFKRCQKCGKRAFSGSPCKCAEPEWVVEYNPGAPSSAIRMQRWHEAWAVEALRVTKPGGYLLAFGGTRTHHRLVCGLEDAGWIIRDELDWIYASGFPKGKANLKPAHEPIVLARKPGPLRPLAIDACRIAVDPNDPVHDAVWTSRPSTIRPGTQGFVTSMEDGQRNAATAGEKGRWPSNLLLSDPELFDQPNPYVVGSGATVKAGIAVGGNGNAASIYGSELEKHEAEDQGYGDSGGYSRFFVVPKADRGDREPVLRGQLKKAPHDGTLRGEGGGLGGEAPMRENQHPTVKPTDLMRHLVRLVTPQGGTVLDCFLGSGSTAIAAELEGFAWIGIEKEPEYVAIVEARLNGTQRGLGLHFGPPDEEPAA